MSTGLLGVAGGRVWLVEHGEVLSVSLDGRSWWRYEAAEMGVPVNTLIREASGDGPVWFARSAGLVAFDGVAWHRIVPPVPGVRSFFSMAAAPDGAVWVTGVTADRNPKRR